MDNNKLASRVSWKNKDIIRHKLSKEPLLVLHVFIDVCTLVVKLDRHNGPATPFVLLPGSYDEYAREKDFECREVGERTNFVYSPLSL